MLIQITLSIHILNSTHIHTGVSGEGVARLGAAAASSAVAPCASSAADRKTLIWRNISSGLSLLLISSYNFCTYYRMINLYKMTKKSQYLSRSEEVQEKTADLLSHSQRFDVQKHQAIARTFI